MEVLDGGQGQNADQPGDGPCVIGVFIPVWQNGEKGLSRKGENECEHSARRKHGERGLDDERARGLAFGREAGREGEEHHRQRAADKACDVREPRRHVVGRRFDFR